MTGLEYKGVHSSTKDAIVDVDEAKGIITGYFSVFGNKDSDSDIIVPGAYTKTLKENYNRIKHLYQHDPWKPLSGTKNNNLTLSQDAYGLKYESIVSKTSYGRDVIRLHLDGVIDENSVGFQTIKSEDKKGYRELQELKLWEGSSVTWGANDMAMNTGVKSMDKSGIVSKMDIVMKAIRNGKYENEDLFDSLEIYFKQLQNIIDELTKTTKPLESSTLPVSEVKGILTTFTNNLISK